jgi:cobalt-zinc-cadmium efflux system protein
VALLAAGGAAAKLGGALAFSSRSLLADALTSVASLAALALSLRYHMESLRPPDSDHPYGHERLALASNVLASALYAAVAGFMAALLLAGGAYRVSPGAPLAAAAGGGLYLASILLARGLGESFRAYSTLSTSEVIESVLVIASSLAGATVSYTIDLAGAWVIVGYVAFEVWENLSRTVRLYSDQAAPPEVYRAVVEEFERAGLRVARVRIRVVRPGRYQGDVAIAAPPDSSVAEVHGMIQEARRRIERRGIDVVVYLEPVELPE